MSVFTSLHYYSFQAYSVKAFIVLSFCQFKYYTFTILLFSTQLSVDYIWRKSWIMFLVTFLHYYSFQAYSKSALIVSSFTNLNITHLQFYCIQPNSLYKKVMNNVCSYFFTLLLFSSILYEGIYSFIFLSI